MAWTSETVVSKIYETAGSTNRYDAQRLEQWLAILRRRPPEETLRALLGVFENSARAQTRYLDQEYAGHLLMALQPPCPVDVVSLIRPILATWDPSVEQLPWYFDAILGRESFLRSLDSLAELDLSPSERKALETFHYWLRMRGA